MAGVYIASEKASLMEKAHIIIADTSSGCIQHIHTYWTDIYRTYIHIYMYGISQGNVDGHRKAAKAQAPASWQPQWKA